MSLSELQARARFVQSSAASAGVHFDEDRWVNHVRRSLEREAADALGAAAKVFDVPAVLRETKPEAYLPQHFALGPYHCSRPELRDMERYKLAAAKRAEKLFAGGRKFDHLVQNLLQMQDRMRAPYHRMYPVEADSRHTQHEIPDPQRTSPPNDDGDHPVSTIGRSIPPFAARRRRRGAIGPDSRISPMGESAVCTALKNAHGKPGQCIFTPVIGAIFNSCEEAKEFYNLYSWEVGFGIRAGKCRRNGNNYRTTQEFVCSCQGNSRSDVISSIRSGCKAMVRLHRTKDHAWYFSNVFLQHNHPLSTSLGENKQWNSHNVIDPITKDLVFKLRQNNISIGRVCSVIGVSGELSGSLIRKEAVRSLCARIAQENIKDDISKTFSILNQMKNDDHGMEVCFDVDSEGRIKNMLWCTGKNRSDYKLFGDVVTFDTTYRTNLYDLPFGIFVGVNNHFQSVIFGGVLLTHETAADFAWSFTNFIRIMDGKEPITMLTDQCAAMARAISLALPHTKHRWCRWHVLRKAKQKIGPVYSKHSGFKRDFHRLITFEIRISKFERRWRQLVKQYGLSKNKYMARLFRFRKKWAKPYFMDVFCAGMTSTQRSESANHMLKRYIQRSSPMHTFVSKFNDFQSDRITDEQREIHVNKLVKRRQQLGLPIERHAQSVYTDAMFSKFYDQLFQAGRYLIHERPFHTSFVLVDSRYVKDSTARKVNVFISEDGKVQCDCGMFEHMGMLCRHSLKVLVHLDKLEIPELNIHPRWTRAITASDLACQSAGFHQSLMGNATFFRKNIVLNRVLEIASSTDSISEDAFVQTLEALDAIVASKVAPKPTASEDLLFSDSHSIPLPTQCPVRRPGPGRPQSSSLNCWKKSRSKKQDSPRNVGFVSHVSSSDPENPPRGKTKALVELIKP